MIITFLSTWLVGCSLGMLLRRAAAKTTPTTPTSPPEQPSERASRPTGLEDDPARWLAAVARSDWTELDERQLIRLLTDSAS